MAVNDRPTLPFLGLLLSLGLIGLPLAAPREAQAQHRAHLSQDLKAQIASGAPGTFSVLVEAPQSEVDRLVQQYGVQVLTRLDMGALLGGTGAQFDAVAGDANVSALTTDDIVVGTMGVTTQLTGANLLWPGPDGSAFGGLTGSEIGVAVLDSGIAGHPDLKGRVGKEANFVDDSPGYSDRYGHGTHVASIIAGSGAGSQSAAGRSTVGMAPGAVLINLRVLGADGTGYVSDVIQGIEWAIRHKDQFKIRVLNISLGHFTTTPARYDPLARAAERAVKAGIVVVASAGNLGKDEDGNPMQGAVVSPGYTPGAITVGALNTRGTVTRSDDLVASYASRGPVGDPDDESTWEIKPDLVAPGNAIVAAGAEGSYLWENYPERRLIGSGGGTYLVLSGSSMATAVVSGAVAQLLQAAPELTPARVKAVLQLTAQHLDGFALVDQGAGSLNVPLAVMLAQSNAFEEAPAAVEIGGEIIEAGDVAFTSRSAWGRVDAQAGEVLAGNSIIWSSQSLRADTLVWGSQRTGANTLVWGSQRTGANTLVWGSQRTGANTLVWGSQRTGANTLVWGSQRAGANTLVWGSQRTGANTLVWGSQRAGANTLVWGSQRTGANTLVWGSQRTGANTLVWGSQRTGANTLVWGSQRTGANTLVWGSQRTGANTLVWGSQRTGANTLVWGSQRTGANTLVWGSQRTGANTLVWGSQRTGANTLVWGSQRTGANTLVWGSQRTGANTLVWGSQRTGANTLVWGSQRTGANTLVWGSQRTGANTLVWGSQRTGANTLVWGSQRTGANSGPTQP